MRSCVERTETSPVGAMKRLTEGEPTAMAGAASTTPPRTARALMKSRYVRYTSRAARLNFLDSWRYSSSFMRYTATFCGSLRGVRGSCWPEDAATVSGCSIATLSSTSAAPLIASVSKNACPHPMISSSTLSSHLLMVGASTMASAMMSSSRASSSSNWVLVGGGGRMSGSTTTTSPFSSMRKSVPLRSGSTSGVALPGTTAVFLSASLAAAMSRVGMGSPGGMSAPAARNSARAADLRPSVRAV
mmetsp:Transcript_9914/g.21159  ORF Transcript_9914/g.21159 Transcript_9914/m.21159 type:complete len:245 (-) Transcript_9914:333-1067(-)